ncbi:MAG: S8/S53 family peptidase [Oscillatoriophycideae cyanobacterium NC_groundwater_1537_Pr4_S-0.65um_50_18]|nr:S8/S53 family peptidase [Oscillatoriophycideae cyanobacterium NC_groundwater_1537_Pr4_S-0.65um_50_18]
MKHDSYSDQQAHTSFQPRSPQSANDSTQLGQPVHHSSSTSSGGANWLNKASRWVADKFQTAQSSINGSGETIAPDQILPALKGTANRSLSQSAQSNQPLVGVIDSGFGTDEHGSKMVEAIQKENPQAKIWRGRGVGTGGGVEALVKFVDVAKATGQSRAVANLSFDLTEVHPDGSISTRTQLTAKEQSALAYARDNGVLVVASAGNQGGAMSALGQASQPFDNLIVVGAANGNDRASYSSYGKGLDLVADVGAAGTSLAAAKTTGAIAKLWSDNPELSSQQVNKMLTATATDLKAPGWDAETGAGLLNSGEAIDLAKTITPKTQMFSGNQLMQQLNQSSEDSTWRSTNGSVASERTAGFAALVKPNIDAMREAINLEPKAPNPPDASDRPNWNLFDGIAATARKSLGIADAEPAAPEPNPPDSAAMEQHNPALGQVAIQQGDTLWDVAQKQLGSGDRWRELRKADGSPFTEQEASQLQVGTSVQIPGAQPAPPLVDGGILGADIGANIGALLESPPPIKQPNLPPPPETNPPAPPAPAPASEQPNWDWSEIGHTALDILGTFDPTPIVDGVNTAWYAAEGDWLNAGISATSMVPYVGDFAKGGKYFAKGLNAADAARPSPAMMPKHIPPSPIPTPRSGPEPDLDAPELTPQSESRQPEDDDPDSDFVTIYKAPSSPGLAKKLETQGFYPEDFSIRKFTENTPGDNSAYFAKDKELAQYWATIYKAGILKVDIPRDVYDRRIRDYEEKYDGSTTTKEIQIPHEAFDVLNAANRELIE